MFKTWKNNEIVANLKHLSCKSGANTIDYSPMKIVWREGIEG